MQEMTVSEMSKRIAAWLGWRVLVAPSDPKWDCEREIHNPGYPVLVVWSNGATELYRSMQDVSEWSCDTPAATCEILKRLAKRYAEVTLE